MLAFWRKRREKRERMEALQELGRNIGDQATAELSLFIEMNIVPKRKAFLEVLHGQHDTIDERLKEFEADGEVSREEAAAIDVRLMLENWDARKDEQLKSARQWLSEQYEIAAAVGAEREYHASVEDALTEQRLILLTDGMASINRVLGHPDQQGA